MRNLLPLFLYFASLLPALRECRSKPLAAPPYLHLAQLELLSFVCDLAKNLAATFPGNQAPGLWASQRGGVGLRAGDARW